LLGGKSKRGFGKKLPVVVVEGNHLQPACIWYEETQYNIIIHMVLGSSNNNNNTQKVESIGTKPTWETLPANKH
jgi:hypothetical protein